MATLDLQVGANADDASEYEGDGSVNTTLAYIRHESGTGTTDRRWGAHRWVDSSISLGNTIDVAYGSLYIFNTTYDDINGNWHFQLGASPATFTTTANDITNRSRTVASVSHVAIGVGIVWANTPSLVTPLQEVVDSYSPTAFALIFRPNTDTFYAAYSRSYDFDTTLAAKLHIEYTAGGVTFVPRLMVV